jgi:transglutaminase-like putative cysteine protease
MSVLRFLLPLILMVVAAFPLTAGCSFPSESNAGDEGTATDQATETVEKKELKAERKFRFRYAASVNDVPAGAEVKVWFPIAESDSQQSVVRKATRVPAEIEVNRDAKYGNQIGFFQIEKFDPAKTPNVAIELSYDVKRKRSELDSTQKTLAAEKSKLFLTANRLVPNTGKPAELLADRTIPKDASEAGKLLYEIVESHMKYDKSKPGYGNGDSVWACDSKTGNCTDFHSLFISLARNQNIPARFQIGFPLSPTESSSKVGGYHCWAWFHIDGQGWLPVDISEADKHPEMKSFYFGNLTADRIAFSTGRDIELVPESKSEPLNYFVYPHVEVDGKVWPREKIRLDFSYRDLPVSIKQK